MLSPSHLLSSQDMEDFAQEFLGLSGTDSDLFYESYLDIDNDEYEEVEYRKKNELEQEYWEY